MDGRDVATAVTAKQRVQQETYGWEAVLAAAGDVSYRSWPPGDGLAWAGDLAGVLRLCDGEGPPASLAALAQRVHPEDLEARLAALRGLDGAAGPVEAEWRLLGADGVARWLQERAARLPDGSFCAVLRPLPERRLRLEELERRLSFDELTGRPNREHLGVLLDEQLQAAVRAERSGALLVVGIDRLGRINAAFGHEAGDAVIVEVGRRLADLARPGDVVGRLGGDRFALVLAPRGALRPDLLAERLLDSMRRRPIPTLAGPLHASVSIGLLHFPEEGRNPLDAIARAESALIAAKAAGRDCASEFRLSEEETRELRDSMVMGEEVKRALAEDRLLLAFQPVVAAASGRVELYECLLRLRRPDGSIVPAGRFVPVAEKIGLMRLLDRHVLDLALDELERHAEVRLSVNISGHTAADEGWLARLSDRVAGAPEVARRLLIEITETAALLDLDETARFLSKLRRLGCRIALDDFGAGYTSFRHLRMLEIDVIKIDGSFVNGILRSAENHLIVRNILGLAQAFGLKTVAEGVEEAEEVQALAALGVDFLQGYHLGRPALERPWLEAPVEAPMEAPVEAPTEVVGQSGSSSSCAG